MRVPDNGGVSPPWYNISEMGGKENALLMTQDIVQGSPGSMNKCADCKKGRKIWTKGRVSLVRVASGSLGTEKVFRRINSRVLAFASWK